jgi:hypothetical protein
MVSRHGVTLGLFAIAWIMPHTLARVADAQAVAARSSADSSAGPALRYRHRARRSRRAQPDSTRLLQVEAGYDGDFDSPDLRRDQAFTVSAILAPHPRLELEADVDVWASQLAGAGPSVRGRGDTHLTGQWTLRPGGPGTIVVGVAYELVVPTARPASLGAGYADHRFLVLLSRTTSRAELDLTGGAVADGRAGGLSWGAEGALTWSRAASQRITLHLGGSGQTVDTDQPAGLYGSFGLTWQATSWTSLDWGVRAGLTARAPAYGFSAGITVPIK